MSARQVSRSAPLLLMGALFPIACTNAGLQANQQLAGPAFDNLLTVNAHVCTAPAGQTLFPVKILFIVDNSDSMTVTDPHNYRAQAVEQVLNRYQGNPAVSYNIIPFGSTVNPVFTPLPPSPGEKAPSWFTNNPTYIATFEEAIMMGDKLTDYQGALGNAYQLLSQDMLNSDPADRVRTKYVIVFMSDGTPDPECSGGPMPCGKATCGIGPDMVQQICQASGCVDEYQICIVPKEDWGADFQDPPPISDFPELMAGGDYNTPAQIYHIVDQIVALQDFYHVGEVRLHTGFLFDPSAAANPLAAPFMLDYASGADLLQEVAVHGGGTFTVYSSGVGINFLNIDYTSIPEVSTLASLIVANDNTLPTPKGPIVDSDGDGISDADEIAAGTCFAKPQMGNNCNNPVDSDGDGYNDLLEQRNLLSGFDPLDPNKPAQKCLARTDSDGDRLLDCEEAFLGTDPALVDTDGDRVDDWLEFRNGTDPLSDDSENDNDNDGIRNRQEIVNHTDPLVADAQTGDKDFRYQYDVTSAVPQPDGTTCYDLTVRNVQMVTTNLGGDQAIVGLNRLWVYFDQAPTDRPLDFGAFEVGCIDTRYVNGVVKAPASGIITINTEIPALGLVNPTPTKGAAPVVIKCIDLTGQVTVPDGGM